MNNDSRFFSVGAPWTTLEPPAPAARASALEGLGEWPFARSGFPCLGFLATVYDQVAARAQDLLGDESGKRR